MNGRQAKKQRQLFRKTARHSAEELGRLVGNALKPKPKFIPQFVWLFLMGFFIKINK